MRDLYINSYPEEKEPPKRWFPWFGRVWYTKEKVDEPLPVPEFWNPPNDYDAAKELTWKKILETRKIMSESISTALGVEEQISETDKTSQQINPRTRKMQLD